MDAEEGTYDEGDEIAVIAGPHHDATGVIVAVWETGSGRYYEVDLGYTFCVVLDGIDLRPLDALAVGDGAKLL